MSASHVVTVTVFGKTYTEIEDWAKEAIRNYDPVASSTREWVIEIESDTQLLQDGRVLQYIATVTARRARRTS